MDKRNWKWAVGVGLAMMLIVAIMGSTNITGPRCAAFAIDDDFDMYFEVGRRASNALDISYEPDELGDLDTTTLTLQHCNGTNVSNEDALTQFNCQAFMFDTDGQGIGDTNVLTGADYAIERVGVRGISGFKYLRVFVSGTDPSGGGATPVLTVCRRSI